MVLKCLWTTEAGIKKYISKDRKPFFGNQRIIKEENK